MNPLVVDALSGIAAGLVVLTLSLVRGLARKVEELAERVARLEGRRDAR